jgi:hypothetical protein
MELGGVDGGRLLLEDGPDAPIPWWEKNLCGRTPSAPHIDALRSCKINLAFEVLGALALFWTLCTERWRWRDAWDGIDLLLALPTLFALLRYHADPPPALARWCFAMLAVYALAVGFDVIWLLMGRWKEVPSRSMTALTDAGSLWMWMQTVYYNRLLARALARQQAPIAYVTVASSGNQIEASLP